MNFVNVEKINNYKLIKHYLTNLLYFLNIKIEQL